MPYYLSRYIGSGQVGDLCRPLGSDQPGWSAIDLRADGGATPDGNGLNACLLYLPVADADARLYPLCEAKGETVPLAVRAGLAARLNATIEYSRFDDLIAALLLRPPGNAWKPLRANPLSPLAIYLHGLLAPSPVTRMLAAQIFTETWSSGNSASLTSDLTWVEDNGTSWELSGNRARLEGNTGFNVAHAEHQTDTDDQVLAVTLSTFTRDASGQVNAALLGRYTDKDNLYQVIASHSPTWTTKALEKWVAGSGTTLATTSSTTSPGDVLTLTAVDSVIAGSIGATSLGPVTDTAIAGPKYGGISGYSTHANNRIELDDWSLEDHAQGGAIGPAGDPFTVRQSTLRGGDVLRGVASGVADATGAASGIAGSAGVGAAIDTTAGAASGTGTASGGGAAIAQADGASAGSGTVSGAAATVLPGSASSAGAGVVAGAGAAIDAATGSADGVGAASGDGQATAGTTGASIGSGAVSGHVVAIATTVGDAAGQSAGASVGGAIAQVVGTADGAGAAVGSGAALAAAVGSADGIGAAAATGEDAAGGGGTGEAAGSGAAAGIGATLVQADGIAIGVGTVDAVAAARQASVAASVGAGSANGQAQAIVASDGVSAGTGVAAGAGRALVVATGAASGTAGVTAEGEDGAQGFTRVIEVSVRMVARRSLQCVVVPVVAVSCAYIVGVPRRIAMASTRPRAVRMVARIVRESLFVEF